MSEKAILEELFKAVEASERGKKIVKEVLELIPQEAMAVFLRNKDEFLNNLIYAYKATFSFEHGLEDYAKDKFASYLAGTFLRSLGLSIRYFEKEALTNREELLFLVSLVYVGYVKLCGDVKIEDTEKEEIAKGLVYVAKHYRSLENLEEKIQEGRAWYKLYSLYKKEAYINLKPFIFFIERAYGIRVETFDGKEPNLDLNLINIKNAKEIMEAINMKPLDYFKQRGKEIVYALKKEFPFTKEVLETTTSFRYFTLVLLLGTYSKEEFLENFKKNYIDLKGRIADGLEKEKPIVVALINKTLYNQKDFFECDEIADFPRFPKKYKYKGILIKNGYENLAFYLLDKLPKEARWLYFSKYSKKAGELSDLHLVSLYYKYVKSLKNYDETTLRNFFDKVLSEDKRKIIEAWL